MSGLIDRSLQGIIAVLLMVVLLSNWAIVPTVSPPSVRHFATFFRQRAMVAAKR